MSHASSDSDASVYDSELEAELAALEMTSDAAASARPAVNDEASMTRLRDQVAMAYAWTEHLSTPPDALPLAADKVHDDLAREMAFYAQALSAARRGKQQAAAAQLPFTRPDDYFAEMLKTDAHMMRIRKRLMDEEAGLEASEAARKLRERKKIGKKVQVAKQLERAKAKRDTLERIDAVKKKRALSKGGGAADDDFDIALEEAVADDAPRSKAARKGAPVPNRKRQLKNEKYGQGGRKKFKKSNTRDSVNERSYSAAKNRAPIPGFAKRSEDAGAGARRPGKARRQQSRQRT